MRMYAIAIIALLAMCMHPTARSDDNALVLTIGRAEIPLEGPWRFRTGDDPAWSAPRFNDSDWTLIELRPEPGAHDSDVGLSRYVPGWFARGFAGHEGYAWYRLRLRMSDARDTPLAVLAPPYVEDAYQLFWNGQLIASSVNSPGHNPSSTAPNHK